ncbi:ABC transporter substrate-binding protein [Fusobacterium mortiferum]|uniref:ABC transporter substrate-binding protein n=1 Tax=Fusobacterium mortiferum TaxID=850 RepID=UPI001F1AE401|nr:ABC transporter substrate-binding protein [Fusobacterium mortiferum]MCF2699593.1 ABC transporter substrate-binding protein [Fusobacterium mortiferum]
MKKLAMALLLLSTVVMGKEIKEPKNIEIGVTQIMEHPALDSARVGFEKALKDNGYGDVKIDYQNAQGDFGTAQMIANSLAQGKKDLIYAISTPSAQAAYNVTKKIPILITAVTDVKAAGLVGDNITGTSDATSIYKQLETITKILPKAKKVGIIYNTSEQNSQVQVASAKEESKKLGLEIIETGVTNVNDMAMGLDSLLDKVDVLYTPTDNLVVSATPLVLDKANRKNVPVVGCIEDQVAQGALITDTIDYEKLGYQTGEMAIRVLKGEEPKNMPVETLKNTQLIVNKKAAEKYGIDLGALEGAKLY